MKNERFMVAHSMLTNTIYAGTTNKDGTEWISKVDVTQQAIEAVRDYCVQNLADKYYRDSKDNPNCKKPTKVSFEWKRKDGAVVTLQVSVNLPEKNTAPEQGSEPA